MRAGREIGRLSRKQHFDFKWSSQGSTHLEIAFGSLNRLGRKMWFRPTNNAEALREGYAQCDCRTAGKPEWGQRMTGSQAVQELWLGVRQTQFKDSEQKNDIV